MKTSRFLLVLLAAIVGPTTATAAETVKLRALELRSSAVAFAGEDGRSTQIELHYADVLRQVMLAPAQGGASADDLLKTLEVWTPIKRAIETKSKRVLLTDAEYQFVVAKVNAFRWSPRPEAVEFLVSFIAYVRGLKEEEFAASAVKPAAP